MTEWRTDKPPQHWYVQVWTEAGAVTACWTGKRWRTVDGLTVRDVTHWCAMPNEGVSGVTSPVSGVTEEET